MDNWNINDPYIERPRSKSSSIGDNGYLGRVERIYNSAAHGDRYIRRAIFVAIALGVVTVVILAFNPTPLFLMQMLLIPIVALIAAFRSLPAGRTKAGSNFSARAGAKRNSWAGLGAAGVAGAAGASMWGDDENIGDDAFPSSSLSNDDSLFASADSIDSDSFGASINPGSGLPMLDGDVFDVCGNTFGCSDSMSFDDSFDSSS